MPEKEKLRLEYSLKSSPKILFGFLSTPNGLAEWFADDVIYKDGTYHFIWDDEVQKAKMIANKNERLVRFKWDEDESYLEFEILQDELTNDVALAITDFAIDSDKEDKILIWNNQVEDLIHVLGA